MTDLKDLVGDVQRSVSTLLNAYQPNHHFYFASPTRELLAGPPLADLLSTGMANLSGRVNESLRLAKDLGHDDALVIGAVPFHSNEAASLQLSTRYRCQPRGDLDGQPPQVQTGFARITPFPTPEDYKQSVLGALHRFDSSSLEKVVLSRTLNIECEQDIDLNTLVARLQQRNPSGYSFAIPILGTDKTLVGASPELLVSRRGLAVLANPLAGSEPRHPDPVQDETLAKQLLASPKDRREHALVVEAVADALAPLCKRLKVPSEPELIQTPALWHLSTRIEGELASPRTTAIDLGLALHPTPAVCGYPVQAAHQAIADLEPHSRGLFTGMVGWSDAEGDGEWVVTIRCAEVERRRVRLFAGAGIVPGSCPEKELTETGTKFNTLLDALGIREEGKA